MRSGQGSAVGHVVLQQRCSGELNLTCAVPVFVCAQQIDSLSSLLPCGKYEVSIIVPLFFSVTVPGGCHSQGCQGYRTCRLDLVLSGSTILPGIFPKLIDCQDEFK